MMTTKNDTLIKFHEKDNHKYLEHSNHFDIFMDLVMLL